MIPMPRDRSRYHKMDPSEMGLSVARDLDEHDQAFARVGSELHDLKENGKWQLRTLIGILILVAGTLLTAVVK